MSEKAYQANQTGAATLLITMVLMALMTSAAIFTAKFSSQDARINANDYRSKQAEAAAQAGIDHTLNILNKQNIVNDVLGGATSWSIGNTDLNVAVNGQTKRVGSYSVTYTVVDIDNTATALDNNDLVKATSIGKSGDGAATTVIEATTRFSPVLFDAPKANVIARNGVALGHKAKIDNNVSKAFVWSGGAITNNAGAELKNTPPIFTSTLSKKPRLLPNDTLLSTTLNTPDKFFRAFFGIDRAVVKQVAVNATGGAANFSTKLAGGGKFIWISGSATLNGTYGNNPANSGPVIIFVDSAAAGTFVLSGATINGLLYIDGDWTHANASATSTINGALIVNGSLQVTNAGKLSINYERTNILDKIPKVVGLYTQVAGSWQEK